MGARAVRAVIVAVVSGAAIGAVVGGLGGRLAMRLTAVWTDGPAFTLTGAEVGEVTLGGTLALLGSSAQAGAIVGLLYAAVRSVLPSSHRAGVFALLALLLPGGLLLGDTEFKLFDPPLLTAVLFLPAFPVGGLVLAALVERLDARPPKMMDAETPDRGRGPRSPRPRRDASEPRRSRVGTLRGRGCRAPRCGARRSATVRG